VLVDIGCVRAERDEEVERRGPRPQRRRQRVEHERHRMVRVESGMSTRRRLPSIGAVRIRRHDPAERRPPRDGWWYRRVNQH